MEARQHVAGIIRLLAHSQGINMGEVARRTGMSQASFYARLNGTTHFTLEDLAKVSEALNIGMGDLFREPQELITMLSEQGLLRLRGYAIIARHAVAA